MTYITAPARRPVPKTIWFMWLQGIAEAPDLVRACLTSWKRHNPEHTVRVVDRGNLASYLPDNTILDLLDSKRITSAAFSDLVRADLLHEYGGVWVDASVLCNRPLQSWLPKVTGEEAFLFSTPGPDRQIATWFIAATAGHPLIGGWRAKMHAYWAGREEADEYYWAHHAFTEMLMEDADLRAMWNRVPLRRTGPVSRLNRDKLVGSADLEPLFSSGAPLFKLNRKVKGLPEAARRAESGYTQLLKRYPPAKGRPLKDPAPAETSEMAGLLVSTANSGDHVQVIAAERLLQQAGIALPRRYDRDTELDTVERPDRILISGWYKHGNDHWPPSPALHPIYVSFHIRPHQARILLSDEAIEHYRKHQPIHCRDKPTADRLRARGVEADVSRCLTATLPTRTRGAHGDKIFVVSKNRKVLDYLPEGLTDYEFVSHYSQSGDHTANMAKAERLLARYRDEGALVITTLLHCALPCLAQGIPTIVCWPPNSAAGHQSDRERFMAMRGLTKVHTLEELKTGKVTPTLADLCNVKARQRILLASELDRAGVARRRLDLDKLAPPRHTGPSTSPLILERERKLRGLLTRTPQRDGAGASKPLPAFVHAVRKEGLTFLGERRLRTIVETVGQLRENGVRGAYVEAGCALGGSTVIIANCRPPEEPFYVYDVFGMIPPPGEEDPERAHKRFETIAAGDAKGLRSNTYYGYVDDLYEKVRENIARHTSAEVRERVHLVRGLLEDTMQLDEDIAFAHIDVDWHDPVSAAMQRIAPRLVPGGSIIVDDYADWGGCRKAVDAFLAETSIRFEADASASNLKLTRL